MPNLADLQNLITKTQNLTAPMAAAFFGVTPERIRFLVRTSGIKLQDGRTHPSFQDRLESQIVRITESGCWLWIGNLRGNGYGCITVDGKTKGAHRVAYEFYRGQIPKGLHMDHICRVRCCVNPSHLEPVTPQENIRRGKTGENMRSKTHCPKGHPYSGMNLYINPSTGGRCCRTCHSLGQRMYRRERNASSAL